MRGIMLKTRLSTILKIILMISPTPSRRKPTGLKRMSEKGFFSAGEEGVSISEEVLNKFKTHIDERADDINADITGNLALLEGRIKEYYDKINSEVSDFENRVGGKSGELQTLRNDILELDDKVHALIDNSAEQLSELEEKRTEIKEGFLTKITEDVESPCCWFQGITP